MFYQTFLSLQEEWQGVSWHKGEARVIASLPCLSRFRVQCLRPRFHCDRRKYKEVRHRAPWPDSAGPAARSPTCVKSLLSPPPASTSIEWVLNIILRIISFGLHSYGPISHPLSRASGPPWPWAGDRDENLHHYTIISLTWSSQELVNPSCSCPRNYEDWLYSEWMVAFWGYFDHIIFWS